jgi:hypothetical protein
MISQKSLSRQTKWSVGGCNLKPIFFLPRPSIPSSNTQKSYQPIFNTARSPSFHIITVMAADTDSSRNIESVTMLDAPNMSKAMVAVMQHLSSQIDEFRTDLALK